MIEGDNEWIVLHIGYAHRSMSHARASAQCNATSCSWQRSNAASLSSAMQYNESLEPPQVLQTMLDPSSLLGINCSQVSTIKLYMRNISKEFW